MRQKVSSPLPITSVSSGPPQGRASPDTRPTAPRAARISRSCFVIAKGFHPPSVGGGNHRPGLFPLAALPTHRPQPLTCWTLLVSGTANSSFSLGVFTVILMIRGSAAAKPWAEDSEELWAPADLSAPSDMAGGT